MKHKCTRRKKRMVVTVKNEDGTDLVEIIGRDKWSLARRVGEVLLE